MASAAETESSCSGPRRCWKERIPPKWMVLLGAVTVQVGFGFYPVLVKKFAASEKADPIIFSFYRDVLCFPVLFLCAFVAERRILIPRPLTLLVLLLLGLLGMFGNQLLYLFGVYLAGPDIASAFQPAIPVWTTILAFITCTEKWTSPIYLHTWVKIIGVLLSAGGAFEITIVGYFISDHTNSTSNEQIGGTNIWGYICLFGNTLCMSSYVLVQKKLIFNRPICHWKDYPVNVTAYSYMFGAIFMGMPAIYYVSTGQSHRFQIPESSLYALVYSVFIVSALCYLLLTWINMHLPTTIVTSFWPTQVVVSLFSAYFITGDQLITWQYIGSAMLLVGLCCVLFANHSDDRLAMRKRTIRLDCCLKTTDPDEEGLLQHGPSSSTYKDTTVNASVSLLE